MKVNTPNFPNYFKFIDVFIGRYDHLAGVIAHILEERPENAADRLEDISKHIKKRRFVYNVDNIPDLHEKSLEVLLAELQSKLFLVSFC